MIQGGVFPETYKYNDFCFEKNKSDTLKNPYKLVLLKNKQFAIYGSQTYPHPFVVSYYDAENNFGKTSDFFFADAGIMNIKIDDLSSNKNIGKFINTKSNKEYQYLKRLYSNCLDTLTGLVYNLDCKLKIINRYITRNPNSYVALWDMVIDYAIKKIYTNDINKEYLLKCAHLFSAKIKKTNTYKALIKNIKQDLSIKVNEKLPKASLNLEKEINITMKKNKFILLDFWFSSCLPCIAQFPGLKYIYDLYHENGFEIIGISVDQKAQENNWKKIINNYKLTWKQYLDINEALSIKYNVTKYPTNFLIDKNGKIIGKDLTLNEIEDFLLQNVK